MTYPPCAPPLYAQIVGTRENERPEPKRGQVGLPRTKTGVRVDFSDPWRRRFLIPAVLAPQQPVPGKHTGQDMSRPLRIDLPGIPQHYFRAELMYACRYAHSRRSVWMKRSAFPFVRGV